MKTFPIYEIIILMSESVFVNKKKIVTISKITRDTKEK